MMPPMGMPPTMYPGAAPPQQRLGRRGDPSAARSCLERVVRIGSTATVATPSAPPPRRSPQPTAAAAAPAAPYGYGYPGYGYPGYGYPGYGAGYYAQPGYYGAGYYAAAGLRPALKRRARSNRSRREPAAGSATCGEYTSRAEPGCRDGHVIGLPRGAVSVPADRLKQLWPRSGARAGGSHGHVVRGARLHARAAYVTSATWRTNGVASWCARASGQSPGVAAP